MKIQNAAVTVCACLGVLALTGLDARAQNLFVGSVGASSLYEFSGGTQTTFGSGLDNPSGLAFDASGDLFETDGSGKIFEWVGGGTTMTTFAEDVNGPSFMAINAAGDVFVNAGGSAIDEFNPGGLPINTITDISSSGLSGMAFDSEGNLYVACINGGGLGAGFITKIAPNGAESTFASGLNYPAGIAFNAAGDLFVANGNLNDTITEITPAGVQSTFASGLANNPSELAFDRAGDLFVAEIGNNGSSGDITEIAANGTRSVLSSSVGSPATLAFQGIFLPVPEPSAYAFFALGVPAFLVRSFKGKRAV